MNSPANEHRGIVQRIENGHAIVAMETAGCASCGQGSHCGIGQLAGGRPATLVKLPAAPGIRAGDPVCIAMASGQLGRSALLGYLFPAFAMLLGGGLGTTISGSDGAAALGAMLGFVGALVLTRLAIAQLPALMPAPQMIPLSHPVQVAQQEFHHEH